MVNSVKYSIIRLNIIIFDGVKSMNEEDLLYRLELIEFKLDLLFDDTAYSRLLFEHDVDRQQKDNIYRLFDSLRMKLNNNEEISSVNYESEIYEILPQINQSYHVAEDIAQTLHGEGRYEEVFEALYGDSPKFQSYLNK